MKNLKSPLEPLSIGDLQLDQVSRVATWQGKPLELGDRSFDALVALIGMAPEVVSKADLAAAVWPLQEVSDETISQRISLLRKALKPLGDHAPVIKAVHSRGYLITSPKTDIGEPPEALASEPKAHRRIGALPIAAMVVVLLCAVVAGVLLWPPEKVQVLVHPETGAVWMGKSSTSGAPYPVRAQVGDRSVLINSLVSVSDIQENAVGKQAFCALAEDRSLFSSTVPDDLAASLDAAIASAAC